MAIRTFFGGANIRIPGIWDAPKDDCRICSTLVYNFLLKENVCRECAEQVWNILLDEEVNNKGIEAETGSFTKAL